MFAPTNILELLSTLSKSWNTKRNMTQKRIRQTSQKRTRHPYRHIQRIQNHILDYICIYPNSTAYDIWKSRTLYLGEYIDDYRLIRRCINDLCKAGFIEVLPKKKAFQHNKRPCRLTSNGIFYLVIEERITSSHIYNGIFGNYGNNILFESILYPYVKRDTVTHLTEEKAVSAVILFLHECCKTIEYTVEVVNTQKDKHVMEQVFLWERVLGDKSQTAHLAEFLKQKFDLKWLDKANFEKINDDNTLRISYWSNSVLITLNNTRTKAFVEIKGEKKQKEYEFIVESGPHGSLNIMALGKPITEFQAEFLQTAIQQHIHTLIFDLTVNEISDSDLSVLSKDEKFMQRLKDTKVKFDEQYEKMIMRAQLTA